MNWLNVYVNFIWSIIVIYKNLKKQLIRSKYEYNNQIVLT
uniref:Uncharacterized protein n=1 Tax=Anguilla anguilla TaxID=7936 RepID=A0A0E9USJ5_ANGAN